MKAKKWKNIIITYFLTLIASWLLFLPIDIILYRDNIASQYVSKYLIANFFCISIIIFVFINIIKYFNSTFLRKGMVLRFFFEALTAIILSNIILYTFQYIFIVRIELHHYIKLLKETNMFFTNSIEGIFIMLFIETIYMHYQRIETDLEREKFKYNQLKNQLNPHFLFNSLNTLSAMVYIKTPNESVDYIDKLSDFYRYVLTNEGKNLISLKEEIELINKYGDILKTRFQDSFVLNINLKEEDLNKEILFMSLQLLVENSVKHNIASKEIPLIVNIYSENNSIVISNNKVIRKDNVISTGIGLDNLNERYKIVANKEIRIIDDNEKFTVKIPMI